MINDRSIVARAPARAGLLGNPSDGYGGKAIAVTVWNFFAEVQLVPSARLTILSSRDDHPEFASVFQLSQRSRRHGFYGGQRLIAAAIKRLVDETPNLGELAERNFTISYHSTIPRSVGLGGSSAIVIATLRALVEFYGLTMTPAALATLAWRVETKELGIPAGLMDRVVQAYDGLVSMDFAPATASRDSQSADHPTADDAGYEVLPDGLLPPLYLAYTDEFGEPTEVTHGELRCRYEARDRDVLAGLRELAELADQGRDALIAGDHATFARLVDRNFDIRRRICRIHPAHLRMVEVARSAGATAKFCGSGGAIVGTFPDTVALGRLTSALQFLGCQVIVPRFGADRAS